jgi:MoxR-like ATPase
LSASESLGLEQVRALAERILDEVERAIVGKREALELILLGLLADGHVLIEDYPGLAKTLAARSFAQVASMRFQRIQFTPDLMPSDVTGSSIFDQRAAEFEFRPGPIFANLLLADEINRAPPKTQAALLEAMQERQVTIEGVTHRLEPPFVVLATQNPIEYEGTYPLPEAQLDRFLLRLGIGYPERDEEWGVLERRLERADAHLDAARARAGSHVRERGPLHGRRRRRHTRERASAGRGEPARHARAAQARARARGPLGP